jgi:hypothetical protein
MCSIVPIVVDYKLQLFNKTDTIEHSRKVQ